MTEEVGWLKDEPCPECGVELQTSVDPTTDPRHVAVLRIWCPTAGCAPFGHDQLLAFNPMHGGTVIRSLTDPEKGAEMKHFQQIYAKNVDLTIELEGLGSKQASEALAHLRKGLQAVLQDAPHVGVAIETQGVSEIAVSGTSTEPVKPPEEAEPEPDITFEASIEEFIRSLELPEGVAWVDDEGSLVHDAKIIRDGEEVDGQVVYLWQDPPPTGEEKAIVGSMEVHQGMRADEIAARVAETALAVLREVAKRAADDGTLA
jgi:hypothetical protein